MEGAPRSEYNCKRSPLLLLQPLASAPPKGIRNGWPSGTVRRVQKSFESGTPPYNAPLEAIEKMHRATAELKAAGGEEQALEVSDRAPNFTLFKQDHVEIILDRPAA